MQRNNHVLVDCSTSESAATRDKFAMRHRYLCEVEEKGSYPLYPPSNLKLNLRHTALKLNRVSLTQHTGILRSS